MKKKLSHAKGAGNHAGGEGNQRKSLVETVEIVYGVTGRIFWVETFHCNCYCKRSMYLKKMIFMINKNSMKIKDVSFPYLCIR